MSPPILPLTTTWAEHGTAATNIMQKLNFLIALIAYLL